MRRQLIAACSAAAVLALPALAQAQPSAFRLQATVAPGGTALMRVGTLPQGEFAFRLQASSDGEKRFTLTQQRNGGSAFTVLSIPGTTGDDACEGAAGSLFCTGVTTPVTPAGRTWTLRVRNRGNRPTTFTLDVTWRRVASAG